MEFTIIDYIALFRTSQCFPKLRHAAHALTYCTIAAALKLQFCLLSYFYFSDMTHFFKNNYDPIKESICGLHLRMSSPLPLYYTYYHSPGILSFFIFLINIFVHLYSYIVTIIIHNRCISSPIVSTAKCNAFKK